MKNGNANGDVTLQYADGRKYVGYMIDNKETGQGVFTSPSGDRYEIRRSCPGYRYFDASREVFRVVISNVCERIRGEFKEGTRNGKGAFYYADGRKYIGDWVEDKKTGHGVFTLPSGAGYETCCSHVSGIWFEALRALYLAVSGSRYKHGWGEFKGGKIKGKGTFHDENGGNSVGDWVDAKHRRSGVRSCLLM
jgi:hypothetical protein